MNGRFHYGEMFFLKKNYKKNNCQKYLDIQGSTFVPERKTTDDFLLKKGTQWGETGSNPLNIFY